MDGSEASGQVVSLSPESWVLVLTSFDEDDQVFGALKARAAEFLIKDNGCARCQNTSGQYFSTSSPLGQRMTLRFNSPKRHTV
ncbi:response regulator transcription factor [Salinispora arenicola]|uniref:response regulator transcription factor n=1 Tax=Salinispora arenicola TaxID=168697 RepID=UPI0003767149|nr:response regulator transcription factor [Salinispora arenicola]